MSRLVVYTAIMGSNGDKLRPPLNIPDSCDADFVCFSDHIKQPVGRWRIVKPVWSHPTCSRRTARYHKVNPHTVFPTAECSIWLDGSEQLLEPPEGLIERYLSTRDFAAFKHPQRRTVSKEVVACVRLKKDKSNTLAKQLNRYIKEGFKDKTGLFETGMLVRRHTDKVRQISELWWEEIEKGSFRDQVSLPYVLDKLDTRINHIAGRGFNCPHLKYWPHGSR